MIRYISVLFIFSLVLSQEIINEESKNDSTLFEFIVGEEMTDLELMLIADINRNKIRKISPTGHCCRIFGIKCSRV